MSDPAAAPSRGPRFPLGVKLAAALCAAALVMLAVLLAYFGPKATESFLAKSDGLIDLSRDAMREMARRSTLESQHLFTSLIRQTAESRRRSLEDLPLSLYGGDIESMRRAIERSDTQRREHLERNVEILAREMQRRAFEEIDARLDSLGREQTAMGAAFASDIRRSYLLLAGALLLGLVALLGFGLYHGVVIPLKRLQGATQAVARGDLDVEVPVRSGDEVGRLARDFGVMVRQLRDSRRELQLKKEQLEELNRNLESEVDRKTRHLEQALDDLRRAQRHLIHAEKMASIGTLARGVAHEFNNLIGGIRGCAREAFETEEDEERRETLEVILHASERAGEVTRQLLRFSRQEALAMRPVDLARLVDEALLLVEPDARKRGVAVRKEIGACAPVTADGGALHQVLLNLCTNALQAMPDGGELSVAARTEGAEAVLEVADTGEGIPADRIDRIFEPFYTTKDGERDPFARGTGRGLR